MEVETMFNFEDLYTISCEEFYNGDREAMMEDITNEILEEGLVEG